MLVLARRENESIIVTAPDGTRIKITIVTCYVGKARVGIDAPLKFTIHREEVQSRIDDGEVFRRGVRG